MQIDGHITSHLYIYAEAMRWTVRLFKFKWQKVKGEFLEPGFTSISPDCISKFEAQRDRNVMVFTIFGR